MDKQNSISVHIHLLPLFYTSETKYLILGEVLRHHLVIIHPYLYLWQNLESNRRKLNVYHCPCFLERRQDK